MDKEYWVEKALEWGAAHAVVFEKQDIVYDSRTILKCMFGCDDWGKGHTCPSRAGSLKPWEYRKVFEEYQWGLILHSSQKPVAQQVSFAVEREAFIAGYYLAFSLSDCALCNQCLGRQGKECAHPKKARPAFHSVGIDVFKTVRRFGLPLATLSQPEQEQNWYAAVFME